GSGGAGVARATAHSKLFAGAAELVGNRRPREGSTRCDRRQGHGRYGQGHGRTQVQGSRPRRYEPVERARQSTPQPRLKRTVVNMIAMKGQMHTSARKSGGLHG